MITKIVKSMVRRMSNVDDEEGLSEGIIRGQQDDINGGREEDKTVISIDNIVTLLKRSNRDYIVPNSVIFSLIKHVRKREIAIPNDIIDEWNRLSNDEPPLNSVSVPSSDHCKLTILSYSSDETNAFPENNENLDRLAFAAELVESRGNIDNRELVDEAKSSFKDKTIVKEVAEKLLTKSNKKTRMTTTNKKRKLNIQSMEETFGNQEKGEEKNEQHCNGKKCSDVVFFSPNKLIRGESCSILWDETNVVDINVVDNEGCDGGDSIQKQVKSQESYTKKTKSNKTGDKTSSIKKKDEKNRQCGLEWEQGNVDDNEGFEGGDSIQKQVKSHKGYTKKTKRNKTGDKTVSINKKDEKNRDAQSGSEWGQGEIKKKRLKRFHKELEYYGTPGINLVCHEPIVYKDEMELSEIEVQKIVQIFFTELRACFPKYAAKEIPGLFPPGYRQKKVSHLLEPVRVQKAYFKSHLVSDFVVSLEASLPDSIIVKRSVQKKGIVFISTIASTLSHTHYDQDTSFLLVLTGKKEVFYAHPKMAEKLRLDHPVRSHSSIFEDVNPFMEARGNLWQFVTLNAGDGLLLPQGWLHAIKSTSGTIAISFQVEPSPSSNGYEVSTSSSRRSRRTGNADDPQFISTIPIEYAEYDTEEDESYYEDEEWSRKSTKSKRKSNISMKKKNDGLRQRSLPESSQVTNKISNYNIRSTEKKNEGKQKKKSVENSTVSEKVTEKLKEIERKKDAGKSSQARKMKGSSAAPASTADKNKVKKGTKIDNRPKKTSNSPRKHSLPISSEVTKDIGHSSTVQVEQKNESKQKKKLIESFESQKDSENSSCARKSADLSNTPSNNVEVDKERAGLKKDNEPKDSKDVSIKRSGKATRNISHSDTKTRDWKIGDESKDKIRVPSTINDDDTPKKKENKYRKEDVRRSLIAKKVDISSKNERNLHNKAGKKPENEASETFDQDEKKRKENLLYPTENKPKKKENNQRKVDAKRSLLARTDDFSSKNDSILHNNAGMRDEDKSPKILHQDQKKKKEMISFSKKRRSTDRVSTIPSAGRPRREKLICGMEGCKNRFSTDDVMWVMMLQLETAKSPLISCSKDLPFIPTDHPKHLICKYCRPIKGKACFLPNEDGILSQKDKRNIPAWQQYMYYSASKTDYDSKRNL